MSRNENANNEKNERVKMTMNEQAGEKEELPISKNEDVEFSMDQADADDLEALERMEAADRRAEQAEADV